MTLMDVFFPGRAGNDRFDDFDQAEATDLGLHFRNEKRRANSTDAKIERVLLLLYVLIAVMIATGALPIKAWLAHFMGLPPG